VAPIAAATASPAMSSLITLASTLAKPTSSEFSENLHEGEEGEGEDEGADGFGLAANLQTLTRDGGPEYEEKGQLVEDTLLPHSTALGEPMILPPLPPVTTASSFFGDYGKKITAFGNSSLDAVRMNIAAAQKAHQLQQVIIVVIIVTVFLITLYLVSSLWEIWNLRIDLAL
jgi:hypothetical protein